MNLAYINIGSLKHNIKSFKNNYSYNNYILNVSNNAFSHGIELVKYLDNEFDYLYTNSFNDALKIRKYNHKTKIIYSGPILEDNIYDLILNDVIIVIKSKKIMDFILNLKIKDKFDVIFNIDVHNFNGFNSKHEINDLLEDIKNDIHINILGIIAYIEEKDYLDFKYIIQSLKNLELIILNNENDKAKIKESNAIILDKSIYGIDTKKKKLFDKSVSNLKPTLEIFSYVDKIVTSNFKKKEVCYAIIPMGSINGLTNNISKVFINDRFFNIKEIKEEFSIIVVDNSISENDKVEIIGSNNRIDFYIKDDVFINLNALTNGLTISCNIEELKC